MLHVGLGSWVRKGFKNRYGSDIDHIGPNNKLMMYKRFCSGSIDLSQF